MKKNLFIIAVILFAATSLQAQEKESSKPMKFSIGANVGIPTNSGYSVSYGADLQGDFGIANSAAITASAGYQNFSFKGGGNYYMIPLLAGAKFNLGSDKMYGHAQLGYAFGQGGGGGFAYAPSIGYYFSPNFDASLKYSGYSFKGGGTLGNVGVRLGYSF
jgi:hypothetical protein